MQIIRFVLSIDTRLKFVGLTSYFLSFRVTVMFFSNAAPSMLRAHWQD